VVLVSVMRTAGMMLSSNLSMVDLAWCRTSCELLGEVKPFGEEPDREEQLEHCPEPARAVRRGYHHVTSS
jgi:hypothetical protein